ncbi:pyruvate dehydrogenase complex dihydrolipoamide acetyltransferase [Polluticoccus soli]|uniref:pyruvate dehydrogenase complex dihydrolipoamide acetyltransferase n=1 Tax=Polluticoccus soli TaxID=3034150 RepID=UPI0023E278D6|nr:pyruvate dehydrogenase complex dihydrolipoamide acetyltransferase [Flavipsychrobacter sp. JY13-12]
MAEAIRMPLLSDTMKEGVIAAWHKKVGDKVKSDDVLADVETDKATMEVMPYVDGTLLYLGVKEGQGVPVNGIIAIIGKEGEDFQSILDAEKGNGGGNGGQQPKQEAPQQQAQQQPAQQQPQQQQAAAPAPKPGDATVVRMPLLSDTMKEGKIVAWHKKVGDKVKSDDVLADVETDKATMEVMPYADGTLLYLGVEEGQGVPVNGIIAIVGKEGTDIQPYLNEAPPAQGGGQTQQQAPAQQQQQSQPAPAQQQQAQQQQQSSGDGGRVKASPLAKKLAQDKGIDISQVRGSGDNGRIIKRDVDNFQPQQAQKGQQTTTTQQPQQGQVPQFAPIGQEGHTDKPLSQMRRVIAQRLAESKFSAPHFYLRMTITMDNAIKARKHINDVSPVKVSFNDLIIKAVAMSLRKHPEVNSSWMGDFIRTNQHIHIGTAVAVDEGLIVPVIKFADQKSLSQISDEANVLIDKARNKKLQPQEFTGNTFTISNLGMMDIDEFTAIINPPDACILAVGKIAPTPVVENGQVVVRQLLKLTLSCDHRVVDGAVGSRFLQTLKAHLENPVTMLV